MRSKNLADSTSPWLGLILLPVGLLLFGWLFNTPEGLLGKADAVGYAVCHRIDVRSFHLGDRAMPLCARCSGMYLGAVLGMVYQAFWGRRRGGMPTWRVIPFLIFFVFAFGLDGLNSYMQLGFIQDAPRLYQPQNWLRLVTGTGMGIVIAAVIYPSFAQTMWRDWVRTPAISGIRSFGVLVFLGLVLDLVVLTENPLVLYPLALLSASGVFMLLTMVYAMVWAMFFHVENRYVSWRQLWLPLVAGFGMALFQIAILDFLRFLFTGTWDGFHFG